MLLCGDYNWMNLARGIEKMATMSVLRRVLMFSYVLVFVVNSLMIFNRYISMIVNDLLMLFDVFFVYRDRIECVIW